MLDASISPGVLPAISQHFQKQQDRATLVRALLDTVIGALEAEDGERVANATHSLRHVKDVADELCETLDICTLNKIVKSAEMPS